MKQELARHSRREVLAACLGAAALVIASRSASGEPGDVENEFKKLFSGKPMLSGKIKLDIPQIAENGLVVPVNIDVESPMTPESYVKAVHIFSDGNPLPNIVTFHFTPESGRAAASNRIRLAKTQNVIAVAELSDGSLHMAKSEVKVTIGGCGG